MARTITPKERQWMERESQVLRIGMSKSSVEPFIEAKIGNVFVYWSPAAEWGKDYRQYALGSPTSNVPDVRELLDSRYVGDDWDFRIKRVSAAKNAPRAERRLSPRQEASVGYERRLLRRQLRTDK